jgi:YD repeat-containing protein
VTYSYDANNELLASVTTFEGTTAYTYLTGQGLAREYALASIRGADGRTVFFDSDNQGRIISSHRDGDEERININYDSEGGATFIDASGNPITLLTNHLGLIEQIGDALGRVSHLDYDANANLVRTVGSDGAVAEFDYDVRGNLTRAQDALGSEAGFTYDAVVSRLTSFSDARGNVTKYGYNTKGDLVAITYPDGSRETTAYDSLGNIIESVNRRRRPTTFTSDERGRVTRETFSDGSQATTPTTNMIIC